MRWFKVAVIAVGVVIAFLVVSSVIGFLMEAAIAALVVVAVVLAVKVTLYRGQVLRNRRDNEVRGPRSSSVAALGLLLCRGWGELSMNDVMLATVAVVALLGVFGGWSLYLAFRHTGKKKPRPDRGQVWAALAAGLLTGAAVAVGVVLLQSGIQTRLLTRCGGHPWKPQPTSLDLARGIIHCAQWISAASS